MRRLITIFAVVVASVIAASPAKAQNVQLYYDAGRTSATSTVEMFRADGGGSTFFFVDMDYSPKVVGAYWEISCEVELSHNFVKAGFSVMPAVGLKWNFN